MDHKKVVIVDDDQDYAKILKIFLQRCGIEEVHVEVRGQDVLKLVAEIQPHLVILDVCMPDLSGDEIAERMTHEPKTKDVPVLFLTSIVKPNELHSDARFIGGFPFVSKGESIEQVVKTIREHLNL